MFKYSYFVSSRGIFLTHSLEDITTAASDCWEEADFQGAIRIFSSLFLAAAAKVRRL